MNILRERVPAKERSKYFTRLIEQDMGGIPQAMQESKPSKKDSAVWSFKESLDRGILKTMFAIQNRGFTDRIGLSQLEIVFGYTNARSPATRKNRLNFMQKIGFLELNTTGNLLGVDPVYAVHWEKAPERIQPDASYIDSANQKNIQDYISPEKRRSLNAVTGLLRTRLDFFGYISYNPKSGLVKVNVEDTTEEERMKVRKVLQELGYTLESENAGVHSFKLVAGRELEDHSILE